ncbi:TPA: hypothetical protein MAO10_005246 [Klebsiella pneumoniae]|nr:hypothetical protein [Klebsiella pneumoniae]
MKTLNAVNRSSKSFTNIGDYYVYKQLERSSKSQYLQRASNYQQLLRQSRPPPEEPPVVPAKKKRGWVFETASILLGTVITLWQSMYNGVMMSVLTDGLIWLGVSSRAAPVCATGLIAFGVCAAPTLLLSFGRWVVNQK